MDLPGGRNWQVWRGGLQHNVARGQSAKHQGMGKMTAVLQSLRRIGAGRHDSAPVMLEHPPSASPESHLRRWLALAGRAGKQFRRAPATVCYLAVVWVAGLVTGRIAHGPPRWPSGRVGAGLPALGHGSWWTPISGGLWASGLRSYLVVTVLGLLILAPAERRMGVARTVIALLVSQAAGLLLAVGLIKLAGLASEPWLGALARQTAVGAVPGLLGVGFALSCALTMLWRRRLRLLLTVAFTISALYIGHLEQVAQACGALAGLVTGTLMYRRARPRAGLRGSQHEVGVLVGMLVAVSVLGGMLAMLIPVMTLVVLLVTRRRFRQTVGRRAARKLTVTLVIAPGVSGAFLLLGYLLWDHFSPRLEFGVLARDLPTRLLAGRLSSDRFLPVDLAGRLLYVWVFLLFWIMVLGAHTAFFLHTRSHGDAGAADRARAILTRGGATLSYMSTWPGNQYWFSPDGRAAIAYRTIAAVAVTVGGPYGDPAALDSAIAGFARFCEDRGLQPCLLGVTEQACAVTRRLGWRSVQIAEDTQLPLAGLQFKGKKWQHVRNALNKAAREGITAEWWSYPEAPFELAGQIRQMSEKWLADKALPEMGFMLGGLDELNDPNIRCLIAVDSNRRVQGITSWMPVYSSGRPAGWTLEMMRRNPEPGTCHGVMEFLIATAALTFREEGANFVSLSGAPLARLDRGEQPCALQRLIDVIADTLEPVYGFQSLLHFKAKFQPVYQPLYLAYPDPATLGSIAAAIGRAFLPRLTAWQVLRLLTKLRLAAPLGGLWPGAPARSGTPARRMPGFEGPDCDSTPIGCLCAQRALRSPGPRLGSQVSPGPLMYLVPAPPDHPVRVRCPRRGR
jgi:lysylphosphatidylglycerol synthetase-like protein (DUF2156 family)